MCEVGVRELEGYMARLGELLASREKVLAEQTAALRLEHELLRSMEADAQRSMANAQMIIDASCDAIVCLGPGAELRHWNAAGVSMLGLSQAVKGRSFLEISVDARDRERFRIWLEQQRVMPLRASAAEAPLAAVLVGGEGQRLDAECSAAVSARDGDVHVIVFVRDVTLARRVEMELRQAQQLESVGRLAAGVAHEINTPVQFVSDSLHFVRDAMRDVRTLLERYEALREAALLGGPAAELVAEVTRARDELDLAYLLENIPRALDRSVDGLERIACIVRSLKEFAHPGRREKTPVDLNHAILGVLDVARNEYKYVADVETDLGELPPVTCHAGDIQQAVLNIVVNAAHAVGDVMKVTGEKGRITVRSRNEGGWVLVSIADTGAGIPPEIRGRVFDPFFTTKEVGKGTGQGLAIARTKILDDHGGDLRFESEVGCGTTFYIRLPVGVT